MEDRRRRKMGWPLSLYDHISLLLTLSSLVVILVLGIVAFFLETVRKIGCKHSLERTDASDAFFEDPNSLKKVPCPSIFDSPQKYLSLIVPTYNEEHRLSGALVETMSYLKQRAAKEKSFTYEVLIVDDGSRDKTSKVAFDFVRKYKIDNVRVLLLGRNHGKGEAVRKNFLNLWVRRDLNVVQHWTSLMGMLHSRGKLLLMLDADGATKITDLEKLESEIYVLAQKRIGGRSPTETSNELRNKISDIEVSVFGSRAHLEKQALATRKWHRNLLMKGFHLVVLFAAGPGIRDTQCGFKMFTRAAAKKLFTNIRLKRWCFDVEIVCLCKHLNIPISEVSVNWTEIPGSKVRLTSIAHMLFELLLIRIGYGLGIWKVYNGK